MSKTITLDEELYKEFAMYGNRDESHNTIMMRMLNHTNEEEAQIDRMNRKTVFVSDDEDEGDGTSYALVEQLEDGTTVRFRISRGDYAGEERTGTVQGGRIEYNGSTWSPTGMAREADQDIRGDDARDSGSYAGPREIAYQTENGEWKPLETVSE